MAAHPDLNIEISIDQRLVDLAAGRFDAGVRLGEQVEKDMIAMRIGPDLRLVVAGAPEYLSRRGTPQTPYDLTHHNCINLHMPTLGGLYAWEFEKDERSLRVRVNGQFTSNDPDLVLEAALNGAGLCCLPDDRLTHSSTRVDWFRCFRTGVRPFPATTSTIRADIRIAPTLIFS